MKPDLRTLAAALLIAMPLALTACGKKAPDAQGTAGGEVLPGSASDAMLPLDSVRSEPPLAEPSGSGESDKATGKTKGKAAGAATGAASDTPPTEAPAEPSAPESTASPQ